MNGDLIIRAYRAVHKARANFNEAVVTHGRASDEARDANRVMARVARMARGLTA